MENCIFCKIANGEIPSATLYEDEDFRVILDLGPASKGHALILPKALAADIYELPDETAGLVFAELSRVSDRAIFAESAGDDANRQRLPPPLPLAG